MFLFFYSQKHNKTNYAELADFDDKRLTVMPVPVPPVNYSDVKIDSRYMELCYYCHTVLSCYVEASSTLQTACAAYYRAFCKNKPVAGINSDKFNNSVLVCSYNMSFYRERKKIWFLNSDKTCLARKT